MVCLNFVMSNGALAASVPAVAGMPVAPDHTHILAVVTVNHGCQLVGGMCDISSPDFSDASTLAVM